MPPRNVRELRDLVIDEVSLVDKGANQHATVTIAKRYGEEENVVDIYDEQGEPVDPASLQHGQVVFDGTGQGYMYEVDGVEDETTSELQDGLQYEDEDEEELVSVGKSAFFGRSQVSKSRGQGGLASQIREELSKALTDSDRDEIISKALGRVDEFEQIAKSAQESAQAERTLRLEREYTEVAKSFNVPVAPEELGGVLMRAAEALSYEDCEVIAKCLEAAGQGIFEERGYIGGGANEDVLQRVSSLVDQHVGKSGVSREELVADVFETNPAAYDEYMSSLRGL